MFSWYYGSNQPSKWKFFLQNVHCSIKVFIFTWKENWKIYLWAINLELYHVKRTVVKSDVFLYKVSWIVVNSEMNPAVFISKGGFFRYWFENWAIFIQQQYSSSSDGLFKCILNRNNRTDIPTYPLPLLWPFFEIHQRNKRGWSI